MNYKVHSIQEIDENGNNVGNEVEIDSTFNLGSGKDKIMQLQDASYVYMEGSKTINGANVGIKVKSFFNETEFEDKLNPIEKIEKDSCTSNIEIEN